MSTPGNTDDASAKLLQNLTLSTSVLSSLGEDHDQRTIDLNTRSLTDFIDAEKKIFQPPTESDMIKSLVMSVHENSMEKSSLFRSLIEHTEPTVNAQQLTEHFSSSALSSKPSTNKQIDEHLLRPFSECVEQYYRILYRVCECTEELKQELRQVKSERDQMSEDLINAENAYTDVKKRNEKLKLIINEHKTVRRHFKPIEFRFTCVFRIPKH